MKHQLVKNLMLVGGQMSNVFFNWSQQSRFTAQEREMMKDIQRSWDHHYAIVHGAMKAKRKRATAQAAAKEGR